MDWGGHGVVELCGVLEQIGGNSKLELAGDRLRVILRGWVRDDPTEFTVASIYSARERWPVNLVKTCGGRRNDSSLAQWISVYYRGKLSGDHRIRSTRLTATCQGAWTRGARSTGSHHR
jgi:hypothetical protein